MPLQTIVFMSRATRPMDDSDFRNLCRASTRNNWRDGVTSVLLHAHGYFVEVLEGPRGIVNTTFGRIAADPRHTRVEVLLNAPIRERTFETCSMGVLDLGDSDEVNLEELREIADLARVDHSRAAQAAKDILARFTDRYNTYDTRHAA